MANALARIPIFFQEVRTELAKVSWPARHELIGATWVVVTITAILTIYIGILDFFLSKGVEKILR